MESLINAVLFVSIAVNLVLGGVVFLRGPKEATNKLYSLISFCSAIWSAALVGFHLGLILPFDISWLKIIHLVGISIAFFFLVFTVFFPKKDISRKLLIPPALLYLLNCFLVIGTDSVVADNSLSVGGYVVSEFYVLYALSMIFFFFLGFVFLVGKIRRVSSENKKYQIIYVLAGSMLSSTLAIVPNLILPYYGMFSYTWLGPIFTLIIVGSIFMAMLRHRLFDIRVVLTEIFVGIILVALSIELVLIDNFYELLLKALILILVLIFSFLLVKGVNGEISSREHIEKLARDLALANKRLNKVNMLKTEFVSLATHQLRSPLTAIKGYVSMILEGSYGAVSEELKEPLSRILTSTTTLSRVVRDFLDVTTIEQGSMKYTMKAFSVKDLLHEIVGELSGVIEKSPLQFTTTIKQDSVNGIEYLVFGDRIKLKQVFMNIIDNAFKYTERGSIRVDLRHESPNIILSVIDTGIGIDPSKVGILFQKFERTEDADRVNVQGTGLGLYLAEQIIAVHGGKIRVKSEGLNKGSTFMVFLKQKKF